MNTFHSVTSSHYATAASPGVSLERGNYRMRAPNMRPLPTLFQAQKLPVRRSPQQQRANKHLAFLLLVLVAACITCFGLAYYLYVTRWDLRAAYMASVFADPASQVTVSDEDNALNRSEKYLSYLPHSGFHNQRIALENALVLAYALNRTLLVPPIRLGTTPIRYIEYNTLFRYHELDGREGLSHCAQIPAYLSRPPECLQYFESAYMPWTWLVNFTTLGAHQTVNHLPTMSPGWISAHYNISPSEIYTLRDSSPYQFRFLDNVEDSSPPQDRYQQDIYIPDLTLVKQRLLQIGTIFGTSRLRLKFSENLAYRAAVRQNMIFDNKDLTGVADSIAKIFKHDYIGVHLRVGDGVFKAKIEATVNSVWFKILRDALGLSLSEICELETIFGTQTSELCTREITEVGIERPNVCDRDMRRPAVSSPSNLRCRRIRHTEPRLQRLNVPLYFATDLRTLEGHPLLSIFRRTFPCMFVLGDFSTETQGLKQLKSPYDDVNINRFVLPFVDALVLSKAIKVVGTEGSTFSKFVEDILWASSHS